MTRADFKESRLLLGLTQAQLAERLGLSRMYISMLERGESKLHPWHFLALDSLSVRSGNHPAFVILLDADVKAVTLNYKHAERLKANLKSHHFRTHFIDHLSWADYKLTNFWHIEKVSISE